jgi:hypothetical protein
MRKWTGLAAMACLVLGWAVDGYGGAAQPAEDLALAPPPVISNPGPEYGDNVRGFQGIPGIERAGNGRLWALWYSGGQAGFGQDPPRRPREQGDRRTAAEGTRAGEGRPAAGALRARPDGPERGR